jgi:hypothetical protein
MGWKNVNAIIDNKLYLGKSVGFPLHILPLRVTHLYLLPCLAFCRHAHHDH